MVIAASRKCGQGLSCFQQFGVRKLPTQENLDIRFPILRIYAYLEKETEGRFLLVRVGSRQRPTPRPPCAAVHAGGGARGGGQPWQSGGQQARRTGKTGADKKNPQPGAGACSSPNFGVIYLSVGLSLFHRGVGIRVPSCPPSRRCLVLGLAASPLAQRPPPVD